VDLKNIYSLIIGYFENKLTSDQKKDLDIYLDQNSDIKSIIEDEKAFQKFIVESNVYATEQNLQKFNSRRSFIKKYKLPFIIIGVLIIACSVLFIPNSGDTNEPQSTNINDTTVSLKTNSLEQEIRIEKSKTIAKDSLETRTKTLNKQPHITEETTQPQEVETSKLKQAENIEKESPKENVKSQIELKKPEPEIQTNNKSNPCDNFAPTPEVQIQNPTLTSELGSLTIEYNDESIEFSINDSLNFTDEYYYELSPGTHTLFAKNELNCIYNVGTYSIKKEFCLKDYSKSFSPNSGEEWELQLNSEYDFDLKIIDKYYKEIIIQNSNDYNETFSWNGTNMNGEQVPVGLYKVIINYSNKEHCMYNVVIIK